MKKNSTIRRNPAKWAIQWITLAALAVFASGLWNLIFPKAEAVNTEAYCPMGGLQALVTYGVRGSLPCSMTSLQIVLGIALAAAVIFFSKLFCSYLCPIGSVEDLLTKFRKSLKLNGFKIRSGSVADKILRIVKYILVFWIFYSTATASELFCKNMDPYYAIATGFKGEITLWMSIVSVILVFVGGMLVDRFWCRYICPLGAVSNTLKFWIWLLVGAAVVALAAVLGLNIPWWAVLAAFCIAGYLLEIFSKGPKAQLLSVIRDADTCSGCGLCSKRCPYAIAVDKAPGKLVAVDCTLCGECVASCSTGALSIGVCKPCKSKWASKWLPAILTVIITALAFIIGGSMELPTINLEWGVEEGMQLKEARLENLTSVKCYGSSMAFKGKVETIAGVHGVRTYVTSHTAVVKYDPNVTNEDIIREKIFVPSTFRVNTPDHHEVENLKVVTIRTENMPDKQHLNHLGMQFRLTGEPIYGIESEFACPLIVRVYMHPDCNLDKAWFKQIVEKKSLEMPVHGGGVKETPTNFKFVSLEAASDIIPTTEFLEKFFDGFSATFNGRYPSGDTTVVKKRSIVYKDAPQFIYEIADQNYEKPIVKRQMPYLSNHLSREEGVIGVSLCLNKDYKPAIQVRYAAPMTADRIWELMTAEKWTITYKNDDVREEGAKLSFKTPGICYQVQ